MTAVRASARREGVCIALVGRFSVRCRHPATKGDYCGVHNPERLDAVRAANRAKSDARFEQKQQRRAQAAAQHEAAIREDERVRVAAWLKEQASKVGDINARSAVEFAAMVIECMKESP